MALPSCICVAGRPPFERLGDIFCALSQIDLGCVTPVLLSATVDGSTATLVFSEDVTSDGSGFSIVMDSDTSTLTYVSGGGTPTLVFTMTPAALEGEAGFLFYDEVTGDATSGDCPLLQIDSFEVVNNTGLATNRVTSDGDTRTTSAGDTRVIT